jgi:NarL family two-component system response regulator LiaR
VVAEVAAILAVAATAALPADPALDAKDPATRAGLSPRELDVVRLIAQGRSNQEIADALYVSHGTVRTHVQHVLNKLGLDSRTAVAAWAIRHDLA